MTTAIKHLPFLDMLDRVGLGICEIRLCHLPFWISTIVDKCLVSTELMCKWVSEVIIEQDGLRVDEKLGVWLKGEMEGTLHFWHSIFL